MSKARQTYLLNARELSPETIAVAFGKTSRSPQTFREIAAELTEEKSATFHEKWVVGYGHASVAEHAVLHIAVENISRLAVETLEGNRLASYTEKSTRYQKWDSESFFTPPELDTQPELKELFQKTCSRLFEVYLETLSQVQTLVKKENPRLEGESDGAWASRIRTDYIDVCRFLLPAASLANVGVTINARNLEYAIQKMLSHPLQEVREMGEEIKKVAQAEVPTLVKYANHSPYLEEARKALIDGRVTFQKPGEVKTDWCRLVNYNPEGEDRILAAALYRFCQKDYQTLLEQVRAMNMAEKTSLGKDLLGKLGEHDIPLREMEYADFTFDLVLDQGAFFELKRHRIATLTPQNLTTHLGYAVPRRMVTAGMETVYRQAMEAAQNTYEELAQFNPECAAYVVPNGFNRRVLMSFNLRTAFHLIALRTAPNAHFSIRRIAWRMAEQIRQVSPILASYMRLPCGESWQDIEEKYFQ